MFDFAGSEFALVAVVALILIGPKDLPVAIKAVTGMIKKARRMASEFQVHVDEMVREADLQEVRTGLNELRRSDIKGKIMRTLDEDGSLRRSMSDPITPPAPAWSPALTTDPAAPETVLAERPAVVIAPPEPQETTSVPAPDFIPPRAAAQAPAFIPPGVHRA